MPRRDDGVAVLYKQIADQMKHPLNGSDLNPGDRSLFDSTTYAVDSLGVAEDNPYVSLDKPASDDGKPGKHSIDFSLRPQFIQLGALVTEIGDGISEYPPLLHQAIQKHWSLRNPQHRDSDLIEQVRLSTSPRHAELSSELDGFMAWRELLDSTEPLQTNFLQADDEKRYGAAHGDPQPVERDTECELEIRPTPCELIGLFAGVQFDTRIYNSRVPAPGNAFELVEYGAEWTPINSEWRLRPFARIGGAEFATETGSKRYPRGAMTRWESYGRWSRPRERAGTPKGGKAKRDRSQALETPEAGLYRKQALKFVKAELSPIENQVAEVVMVAANLAQVGKECGYADRSEKTQERQGKRLVKEVGEHLQRIFAKLAA